MRSLERDKHIQVRFTEPEIVKFKEVAKANGLTLSGFARYMMLFFLFTGQNFQKEWL